MERAISNQMTRLELSEFLSDPRSRKEFFELMKLKSKNWTFGNESKFPIR
ncbi:hypothetical protein LEP1GSC170_3402 [Leptospira interrogans serovar Bataviae str. HAI135]|nr:hypothetical protein LEP1GSC170_3402 [Leptospira interrogans serovar Bataviae str. HAI135]